MHIKKAGICQAWNRSLRIAQEELDALGWAAQDLQGRRKSDPQKVRIASRLRRETTMTLEWIADRLCMGAATHVASLLAASPPERAK